MDDLHLRLIGTWSMISFSFEASGESSSSQQFTSPNAKGFLMYSSDGFMLSLIHEPDGQNLHSYGGPVTIAQEEDRVVVMHHVRASAHVNMIGTVQRRLPSFSIRDGEEVLTVTTDGPVELNGQERMAVVKWRRANEVYKLDT